MRAAAKAANWDARPSPQPRPRPTGIASGRGIACVVLRRRQRLRARWWPRSRSIRRPARSRSKRLVVAQDCGPISNPDGMRNQLEGGALQGLSRALGEEVTWDDRKVTSIDWADLPQPAARVCGADDRERAHRSDDVEACGAGETAITVGRRGRQRDLRRHRRGVRQVPFTPERVLSALRGRSE